jgi:hypothetical protein
MDGIHDTFTWGSSLKPSIRLPVASQRKRYISKNTQSIPQAQGHIAGEHLGNMHNLNFMIAPGQPIGVFVHNLEAARRTRSLLREQEYNFHSDSLVGKWMHPT